MNDKTNKHPRTAALLFNDDSDDQSLTATASHENLGQRLADAEAALEQAGVGCWDWQIGTENVAWTAVMESLWGMEPGEFQGTLDEVAEPIFAEDLERWQESVQRAIEQGVEHRIEMRITRKDGSIRWIEAIGNVIRDEQGTPVRMMGTAMDVTERKTAELSLHDSEAANSAFLQAIPDLIFRLDKNGVHKDYFIPEAEESFTRADKIIGSTVHELLPADVAALYVKSIQECLDHRATEIFEYSLQFENKELKDFEARMVPFGLNEVMVLVRNVTEHKQAEREKEHLHEQLAQSQKMESIGRLAGGVAHDFNNLLQAILGNAELLRLKLSHDKKLRCHVEQILSTGQRSAELTRQLLAFARKQTVAPIHADLNELIERTLNMLRRLIGEHISVHWHPYPAPLPVLVDTAQMDQIVTNVMLNARDALGAIGNITVQTSTVEVGSDESAHADLTRGRYACLKITDDGEGMSESILERVFEPFFTTKKIGEGTGLGLAMVYGAVKQNRGEVAITSTQGKGTQVEINLPLQESVPASLSVTEPDIDHTDPASEARVLVVEDEDAILSVIKDTLEHKGYQVVTAATPSEALAICRDNSARIDLVLTDVIMPEMNGEELVDRLRECRKDLKFIYMSGYPADVIAAKGLLNPGINFIHKPFNVRALTDIVQQCLQHENTGIS